MRKILIELTDDMYRRFIKSPGYANDLEALSDRTNLVQSVQRGIALPKDATNGDLLKTLFPGQNVSG